MKRTISLLSVLALVLAFSSNSYAQQTDASENISASAEVVTELATSVEQNVDFGIIDASLQPTPTLDIASGDITATSGNGQFGFVQVTSGQGDQSVTVNWNSGNPTTLLSNGTDQITWSIEVGNVGGNVTDNSGGTTTITNGSSITLDSSGQTTLIFGGTISAKSTSGNLSSGTYTSTDGDGDVNVSFDYTY